MVEISGPAAMSCRQVNHEEEQGHKFAKPYDSAVVREAERCRRRHCRARRSYGVRWSSIASRIVATVCKLEFERFRLVGSEAVVFFHRRSEAGFDRVFRPGY